jgi:hypothetical protein
MEKKKKLILKLFFKIIILFLNLIQKEKIHPEVSASID